MRVVIDADFTFGLRQFHKSLKKFNDLGTG